MADFFKPIRNEYLADGTLNPISMSTDTQCLNYQIPGGMLSNLLSQLKMMNALDRFDEALAETPRVRKDMGYPPLVTPTSQIIGSQAVQNVLAGERYKNVGAELKAYCRGEYGKTPAPIDEAVRARILNGEKPIEGATPTRCRPMFTKRQSSTWAITPAVRRMSSATLPSRRSQKSSSTSAVSVRKRPCATPSPRRKEAAI